MSVSQDLLFKVAKVYEAAEAVEGAKPKMQQEEHKKMTPDEFSREHSSQAKEAFVTPGLQNSIRESLAKQITPVVAARLGGDIGGLAGLIGGGIYGAYDPGSYSGLDEKGNPVLQRRSRLMGALRGAAGYGLGGALTGAALGNLGGRAYVNATQKNSAAQTFGVKLAKLMAQ